MFISVLFGFIFGLILGTTDMPWGFGDFPTEEMKGRYESMALCSVSLEDFFEKEQREEQTDFSFTQYNFLLWKRKPKTKINDALFVLLEETLGHCGWEYCGH